jgi:hypothetical protein
MHDQERPQPADEIGRILKLVEEGSLSPADADVLLDGLLSGSRAPEPEPRPSAQSASMPPPPPPHQGAAGVRGREVAGRAGLGHGDEDTSVSTEVRRLSRQARRMAHEARRVAKRELKDALREARSEIERAFRLSATETKRAAREVEHELRSIFGEPGGSGARGGWLASLATLDFSRDRVEHTAKTLFEQPLNGAQRLIVRSGSGDVAVEGWDADKVEVSGNKLAWGADRETAQDRAEALPLDVQRRNGDIIVTAAAPAPGEVGVLNRQRMRTDLLIRIPRRLTLSVSSRSGDIVVRNHDGEADINSVSGDVVLHDTTAPTDVETTSGDIHLRGAAAPRLSLTSVSGDMSVNLDLRPGGEYRLRSASGDVVCRLGGEVPAEVVMETVRGDVTPGSSLAIQRRDGRRLECRYIPFAGFGQWDAAGKGRAMVRVITISGDISVSGAPSGAA